MKRALLVAGLVLALPATASAASIATDRQCYIAQQPMGIAGEGWLANSAFSVSGDQIFASGTADPNGNWATQEERAPIISSSRLKPQKFTLTGQQDGVDVATATIRVVNFIVQPKDPSGKPTGNTKWSFAGFTPTKRIYVHVKRGDDVWTEKAGKGDAVCGTLKTRMHRLPAVPASKIEYGKYQIYVDNKRKFKKAGDEYLQYRAEITIFRTFL